MAKKDKRNKKHFGTEEWADLANGQITGEQELAMRLHLNTGCKECADLFALWRRVGEAAQREAGYEPPDSAVRHVRRAFAILAEPEKGRKTFEIPRLVFDSLWQPAMAGVRSSASSPRQVLYRAGEFAVEMRIEPEGRSERIYIAGQVSTHAQEQGEGLASMPVVASGKQGILAEAMTNGLGEFHLAVESEPGMHLSFTLPGGRKVWIPLEGVASATSTQN